MTLSTIVPALSAPSKHADIPDPPLSVSDLNREVQRLLEARMGLVHVEGEVADKRVYSSGHCYFTLKDASATVSCVLFRSRRARAVDFANGDHVRLHARPGLYAPRGQFQLVVENVTPAGAGALLAAFEALRKRLTAEGLFDTARKRTLPALPRRLGVITSAQGDVRHDIARTLARRFPMLLPFRLYPCAVQGARAAPQIVAAIELANREALCDVLIVARGGGSLEDLWAFNEEAVVRAIAGSAIPIVTGVGHETDTTLADYAADLRAATPTAAAERVSPDQHALRARLLTLQQQLVHRTTNVVRQHREVLRSVQRRLDAQQPRRTLDRHAQRLDELGLRLDRGARRRFSDAIRALTALRERHQRGHPARRIAELRAHIGLRREHLGRAATRRLTALDDALRALADRHRRSHPARQIQPMRENIAQLRQRLSSLASLQVAARKRHSRQLAARLDRWPIGTELMRRRLAVDTLARQLTRHAAQQVQARRAATVALARSLNALDPSEVVRRGYAIVRNDEGRVVSSAQRVAPGTPIEITLSDGVLDATTTGSRGLRAPQRPSF